MSKKNENVSVLILDVNKISANTLLIMRICVAMHDNKKLTSFLNSDEVNEKICNNYPDNDDKYDIITKSEKEFVKMYEMLPEDEKIEFQKIMDKTLLADFVYNKDTQVDDNMVRDILKESPLFL